MASRHLIPVANAFGSVVTQTRAHRSRNAIYRLAGVQVDPAAKISGYCRFFGPRVDVGASWVGMGVWLISTGTAGVTIGDNCDIGPGVLITVGSHEIGGAARRAGVGTADAVHVEDGCWIGARAVILPGVTVGRGSVVAAGAVVNKTIPPNSLVGGVPAAVIRRLAPAGVELSRDEADGCEVSLGQ